MNKNKLIEDNNVTNVLETDGVNNIDLKKFENKPTININDLKSYFGNQSWASRIIYNDIFGGVLIRQMPGEGNRLHYHNDTDECWVIIEGKWEWYIDGEGYKIVNPGDILVVRKNIKHKIKCIGQEPGIRLAITKPDVNHIYEK